MAEDPRGRRVIYMSVPSGHNSSTPDWSFEEIRIADYIQAYMTTGKPPAPSPLEPKDPSARVTLGFPPLFQPHTEIEKQSSSSSTNSTAVGPKVSEPVAAVAQDLGEVLLSITCADDFTGHSFEELRYWAYTHNTSQLLPQAPSATYAVDGFDAYQTISCSPEHSNFSLEELRLAHIRAALHPAV